MLINIHAWRLLNWRGLIRVIGSFQKACNKRSISCWHRLFNHDYHRGVCRTHSCFSAILWFWNTIVCIWERLFIHSVHVCQNLLKWHNLILKAFLNYYIQAICTMQKHFSYFVHDKIWQLWQCASYVGKTVCYSIITVWTTGKLVLLWHASNDA